MRHGHDPEVQHLAADSKEIVALADEAGFYTADFGSAAVSLYLVGVADENHASYAARFVKRVIDFVDDEEDGELQFFSVVEDANFVHARLRKRLEDVLRPYKLKPEAIGFDELVEEVQETELVGVCVMPLDHMVALYRDHPAFTNGLPYLLLTPYKQDTFFTRFLNEE